MNDRLVANFFLHCGLTALLVSAAVSAQAAEPKAASGQKPNILVIVADDLGSAELGCQGNRDIPTPHIDSLAQHGVRFTNAYVSCPVCSPTRAGLITGRYQQRFGHEFNPGPNEGPDFGLPLTEVTAADRLTAAGYTSGMVGKWHLGRQARFHPLRRGFQEFFGFLHGAHSYVDPQADKNNLILRGTEPVDEREYLTEAFTREAVAFIQRHETDPFFLYLTYNAVHAPLEVPQKYLDRFSHISDPTRRTFAGMLSALDDGVGAVLAQLRKSGLEQNTLIFFIGDNGGPTEVTTSGNAPLRGFKGMIYEGGIRVPFLMQWLAKLPEGQVYKEPVIALDILPTALAAAGGKPPSEKPLDGVDLLPCLTGKASGPPHDALFWRYGTPRAVRQGRWKLIEIGQAPTQLYDLEANVGETTNVAAKHPEVVAELSSALKGWDAQLVAPLWSYAGPRRGRPINLTSPNSIRSYRPILIAHRGGVVTPSSPECSPSAIRKAADAGYHMVELDVRRTKDDVPIVFHDRDLKRATGQEGRVEDLDLAQLEAIRYQNGEAIATLDDALKLCRSLGLGVMLDVKNPDSPRMLERAAELVRTHGLERSTIALNSDLRVAAPLASVALVHLKSQAQVKKPDAATADRPLAGYFWMGLPKDLPDDVPRLQREGAIIIPAINTFRYPADRHAELATEDIRRLRELGVDGFQIDSVYQDRFGLPSVPAEPAHK